LKNQLALSACVVEISSQRHTPAGIPALDLILEHESNQIEAGQARVVKATLKAVALGSLTDVLGQQAIGTQANFSGFLASSKNGKGLVFHITRIELN
jgi:primosomal replication protein N